MSVVKKMSGTLAFTAFVALSTVMAWSCGGDDGDETVDGGGGGTQGGTGGTGGTGGCTGTHPAVTSTLVDVLAANDSMPIPSVHDVQLLNSKDGKPFSPPITFKTTEGTGKVTISGVPCTEIAWVHVTGNGDTPMSTYDSLSLAIPGSGETLLRMSRVGTAAIAETTANFKGEMDKVAIGGSVYTIDANGRRNGQIGCAQVFIDGDTAAAHPATDMAQRYVASSGLPAQYGTGPEQLEKTLRSGKFYFGNVAPGMHTFRVSLDGGTTFLKLKRLDGTTGEDYSVYIPFARKDATGPFKSILVLVGLDVVGDSNPTPSSCPQD